MCGILVETTGHVCELTTSTRWALSNKFIVNHQVLMRKSLPPFFKKE
ncbi:DUF6012 family protein [Legionella saoudiensis]|nr:DUF6012 family protein [Legionella saoudiensis]